MKNTHTHFFDVLDWFLYRYALGEIENRMKDAQSRNVLPKTNIAPGRRPSQKQIHLPTPVFQVLC